MGDGVGLQRLIKESQRATTKINLLKNPFHRKNLQRILNIQAKHSKEKKTSKSLKISNQISKKKNAQNLNQHLGPGNPNFFQVKSSALEGLSTAQLDCNHQWKKLHTLNIDGQTSQN